MKEFHALMREVKRNLWLLIFLESFVSAFLVFSFLFFISTFFGFSIFLSLGVGVCLFILLCIRNARIYKVRRIEEAYPHLYEKLRTAFDSSNVHNEVVESLQYEVLRDLQQVSPGALFDSGKFTIKLLGGVLFSFLIIFSSFNHLQIKEFKFNAIDTLKKQTNQYFGEGVVGGNMSDELGVGTGAGASPNKNIFGQKSVAQLGDKTIDVTIRPSKYEFTVRETSDEKKKTFKSEFPTEMYAEQSSYFQENIPKNDQEVVKTYFKKLSEQ